MKTDTDKMTKVLLVEKRYGFINKKPLVTTKWIELPNGEEQSFVEQQINEISTSSDERSKLSADDIVTIFSLVALAVAYPFAMFIYNLGQHGT